MTSPTATGRRSRTRRSPPVSPRSSVSARSRAVCLRARNAACQRARAIESSAISAGPGKPRRDHARSAGNPGEPSTQRPISGFPSRGMPSRICAKSNSLQKIPPRHSWSRTHHPSASWTSRYHMEPPTIPPPISFPTVMST